MKHFLAMACLSLLVSAAGVVASATPELSGELQCWHKVTLSLDGPAASEADTEPNPFLDYGLWVTFVHADSGESFTAPGYFAADGDAGESGASSGSVWRAHLAPHQPGRWSYRVRFVRGPRAALSPTAGGEPVAGADGLQGEFLVAPSDKRGRDFRAHGRLQYSGTRYLTFAQSGKTFLKAGPDSPETLLAYNDFDGTTTNKTPLKTWAPHIEDWRAGDPTWRGGKGKGLIGALNYLAAQGLNTVSFLPYNAGGDGQNVWPMTAADDKLHYDCSKLDQWQVVFDHAQEIGLHLHFKLQETENDDNFARGKPRETADALDAGETGVERKLYLKELVARFGYELALNWNLGEENTQTVKQQRDMVRYLRAIDPYDHHVVLHSYPNEQEKRYEPLLGEAEMLTGVSLQNRWNDTHRRTRQWVEASTAAGHPWVCANDEQGPAGLGIPADAGFRERSAGKKQKLPDYTAGDIRKQTLWGNLMAGGGGVEYYFGYGLAENDLLCEDFRSRGSAWRDCRIALEFFETNPLPLVEMMPADELVQTGGELGAYCLAEPGGAYLVYLLEGGVASLDLADAEGVYSVAWFNPRAGGPLQPSEAVAGGGSAELTAPGVGEDWLAVVRRQDAADKPDAADGP